jgi:predicted dinucleotide-binding enzyme
VPQRWAFLHSAVAARGLVRPGFATHLLLTAVAIIGYAQRVKVGVIGAGSMGSTLARRLARLGHEVWIASSRAPEQLAELAAEVGATPASVADAVDGAELVILAIPTQAVVALPHLLFATVPSSVIVIDVGNYHPELRDGRIAAIEGGLLDSQWVAQQIGHPVIKAFNNIFAKSLLERGVPRGTPGRIALPVAGDSPAARSTVLHLIDDLGFEPVDAGSLGDSWRQATGTPAYCKDFDIAALQRALADADRSRVAQYRSEAEARIARALSSKPLL